MATRARGGSVIGIVVVIWLLIGLIAAFQRNYFGDDKPSCTKVGNIALTIVAGPLNYVGVNPKVKCQVPQPSQ